ncbi:PmoA family protein [Bacteroidota bacterium]
MCRRTIYLIILSLFISAGRSQAQSQITAEGVGDKIEIRIDGNLFTNYILSEYEKYPFFFPVNGPSSASVTSMRNALYPHHSSLFFGCDKVNGGNYWQEELETGQIVPLRADIIESGGDKVVIENENIWKRPGAMSPVKDFRIITVTVPSADMYQIDIDITMEMLLDVTILTTNHSLFSGRMDPDLAVINGGTMVNAEGDMGEKGTFGQRSAWMDYHGDRMGKIEGMAILQHPTNEWFPSPWFTRDYGFFSPTPMNWPENGESTVFKKGQKLTLRYRVLVHTGDHNEAGIAQQFEKYKNE